MIIIDVFLYLMGYANYFIMLICIHVMILCIPRTCNLGLNHNNVQPCLSRNHSMSNNSNVYSCLSDASKAFDKVYHGKVFHYIIESTFRFVLYDY